MSTIHNKFTGHEDSYEQAVRESEEKERITYAWHKVDVEERQHKPEPITTEHPDYMRLVVHQMDWL